MIYRQALTDKQKLGIVIKEMRKEKKISQLQLARELIYTQSVISRMEQGYETIHIEVYLRCLNLFKVKHEINIELDIQITSLIDYIFQSYEFLTIVDFNNYLTQVNHYLKGNQNIIMYYDLLCMKMSCLYMLSRYQEARELIKILNNYYLVCQHKCQILYHVLKTQLILMNRKHKSIELSENQIPLSEDSEHGMIQYMWAKFYLISFNYSQAIIKLNYANECFIKENNRQRMMRCELLLNEICLKDQQYELVKTRTLELLKNLKGIHPFDVNKLFFHLGYCYYYMHDYRACIDSLDKINKEVFYEHNFIVHIKNKALFKLDIDFTLDFQQINAYNVLDYLFFNYLDNPIDEKFYLFIEKYLVDEFEINYFKKEYQIYLNYLLNYYYNSKKYKKYKHLSDKIHKIMHI